MTYRNVVAKYDGIELYDDYVKGIKRILPELERLFEEWKGTPSPPLCCICKCEYEGTGNNPAPLNTIGRCCDKCNAEWVMPARLRALFGE